MIIQKLRRHWKIFNSEDDKKIKKAKLYFILYILTEYLMLFLNSRINKLCIKLIFSKITYIHLKMTP